MQITSSAFHPNTRIPEQYTCKSDNQSPPLLVSDIPAGAQSLALIVHDPDAPSGDWVHWTLWNIPVSIRELPSNALPLGSVEGLTSFGQPGYRGPCPPAGTGTHRYIFDLFALDAKLDLASSTLREDLEAALQPHLIAQAQLVGLCSADT